MRKSIANKLVITKSKVSRSWQHYRTEKKKVLSKKRLALEFKKGLIEELRSNTRQKISGQWVEYRERKYSLLHRSPYAGFSYSEKKTTRTAETIQKWYKATNKYDTTKLDKQFSKIYNEPGVKGIFLIFKAKDEQTGLYHYGSNYYTKFHFDRLQQSGKTVYDDLADKLKALRSLQEYTLKSVHMRIIYEKTKMFKRKK